MSAEETVKPTKPFLKWAGNKFRIIGTVIGTIADRQGGRSKYIEPFGGSGAVVANVGHLFSGGRTYGEFNPELVHLMRVLQEDLPGLLKKTEALFVPSNNVEEEYYSLREQFNEYVHAKRRGDVEKSARFIYLNRHCFNGLCRYGPNGFNVPFGRYAKTVAPIDEMEAFAKLMEDVVIAGPKSFEETMKEADADTLVYCDPPYFPLTPTSNFTQYSDKSGFGPEMQEKLAVAAAECAKRNAVVLVSNHDTDACKQLYHDVVARPKFKGVTVDFSYFPVPRFISSKGKDRGKLAAELIAIFKRG
jgi:DNA adenine methylase